MLMLLQSIHRPINSYHSFKWNNLILFLYNVDTLNICMKEFSIEKIIFDPRKLCLWWVHCFHAHASVRLSITFLVNR